MANRLAPATLVLAAAIADSLGAAGAAFALLVVAVPVAGGVLLASVSDCVDGKADRSRIVFAGTVLALIVLAAAARSTVLVSACLALFCVEAAVGAAAELRTAANPPRAERA